MQNNSEDFPIFVAALRVFSLEELAGLSEVSLSNLMILIERKLAKGPVTDAELQGIKELVLYHPDVSSSAISRAALRVFSGEELESMSKVSLTNLGILIERKLLKGPVTDAELQGIKELVLYHL